MAKTLVEASIKFDILRGAISFGPHYEGIISNWLMFMTQLTRILILMLTLSALAACGRAGSLEPPSASVSTTAENAEDEAAEASRKPDRPFILDGILN